MHMDASRRPVHLGDVAGEPGGSPSKQMSPPGTQYQDIGWLRVCSKKMMSQNACVLRTKENASAFPAKLVASDPLGF